MFLVWGLARWSSAAGAPECGASVSLRIAMSQERLRRDGLIEDEQKELRSRFKDACAP